LNHLTNLHDIYIVMNDNNSRKIIQFCSYNEIDIFIDNSRSKIVEIFISVNYLFLIGKNLINLPSKITFNVHGSLLPKYKGGTPPCLVYY
jgi:methionyl-tRNA formyltransferase